jgi:hypothetical protein
MRFCRSRAGLSALLSLCVASLSVGCQPESTGPKDRATLSGTVSLAGTPLRGGTISFKSTTNPVTTSAMIYAGGKYSTDRAPLGKNIVTIETESLKYGNAKDYVQIPNRYADPSSSGLTADIKPGDNTDVNFELNK